MKINIKRLHPSAVIPKLATKGAACFDLAAMLEGEGVSHAYVSPTQPMNFRTGLAVEVPEGHVMLIFSRSGHGFNKDVRLANCVGVIDSDYRGELRVKLTNDNTDGEWLEVKHGDRIAQAMILPVPAVEFVEVDELSETERGECGFGSTGSK